MKKTLLLLTLFLWSSNVFSQTVYVTKTGEKYHSEGCQYLRKSAISIQLKEAVESRYEACMVCKPPTLNNSTQTPQNRMTQTDSNSGNTAASTSVQCSGTTKKGDRCKRMTTNSSGRCYQH